MKRKYIRIYVIVGVYIVSTCILVSIGRVYH